MTTEPMPITGANWIAGQPSRLGDQTFTSVDPHTRTPGRRPFYEAVPAEVDQAAVAAAAAFQQLRASQPASRAGLLEAAAEAIAVLGDPLLETADQETALGRPRLANELLRTTNQLRAFADLLRAGSYVQAIIDPALPERQPVPRPALRRMLVPIGPVAVFGAANFPLAFGVAGGDSAAALAAGCPVIVKGHPGHPATSELVAQALNQAVARAGFPPGCFALLQGHTNAVGQALVQHPLIEAVGFTGSQAGGRALYAAAAARSRPIPVYAEMGSINPVVILPGAIAARPARLAEQLAASALLGSGQFCTKPGVVFVIDSPAGQEFMQQVAARLAQPAPGVLLNEKVERGLVQSVAQARAKASIACLIGGAPLDLRSFSYPNTLLQTSAADFRADPGLQAEFFGPVVLFVLCQSQEDLAAALQALDGTLTATLHAEQSEIETASRLLPLLEQKAGRLIWNGFPTGVEVLPAMQHGGPYPATTAPWTTSVGTRAIDRFLRPVTYQGFPAALLPDALQDHNPLDLWRTVGGELTRAGLE